MYLVIYVQFTLLVLFAFLQIAMFAGPGAGWLDIPFVQQSRAGCGAAAIAMVMQYWTRTDGKIDPAAADGDRIYALLKKPGAKGILGEDLKRYLDDHGFVAIIFSGEGGDVRGHLDKGRPLVVCLAPRGPNAPLHYVVMAGLSDSHALYHDPARGKLIREPLAKFQRHWQATGNWVLLATPRQTQ